MWHRNVSINTDYITYIQEKYSEDYKDYNAKVFPVFLDDSKLNTAAQTKLKVWL